MHLTVVVEKIDDGFRASSSHPLTLTADGESKEKALAALKKKARERLEMTELVDVDLADENGVPRLAKYAGVWKDHPDFDEYVQCVNDYRQSVDQICY